MSHDIISGGDLTADLKLPADALGHDEFADSALSKVFHLPPGSVIAIQAPWGSGKTDALARIARRASADGRAEVVWINPWQYGTSDLLTPLVLAMLERRRADSSDSELKQLKRAATTIIRAGLVFGMKSMAVVSPEWKIYEAGAEAAESVLDGLFEIAEAETPTIKQDRDPIAMMGRRFAEMVECLVPQSRRSGGGRVLVCIDDLDRCLPERQVSLLEAIRFLTSAGPGVTFLVAIDPLLARQAIRTHYHTEHFDPDRYLDKIFQLRIALPTRPHSVRALVRGHLLKEVIVDGHPIPFWRLVVTSLRAPLQRSSESESAELALDEMSDTAAVVWRDGALANPRVIARLMDKLLLTCVPLMLGNEPPSHQTFGLKALFCWLGIAEIWPDFRYSLQRMEQDAFETGITMSIRNAQHSAHVGEKTTGFDQYLSQFDVEPAKVSEILAVELILRHAAL